MTLDFPANPTDGDLYPEPPDAPLWEFIAGKGWKRLGGGGGGGTGGSLALPSEEEATDGTTNTARAWSSLRARQAAIAWYLTEAPLLFPDSYAPPVQRDLNEYLLFVENLQTLLGAFDPNGVASKTDPRFGSTAQALGVESDSALLRGPGNNWSWGGQGNTGVTRGIWTLTINSTAAFSLDVSNLPTGLEWWEATIIITTTQVPASFTFTSTDSVAATKCDVPGATLADRPFATGKVTILKLLKLIDGKYSAEFLPAVTVT